MFISLEVALCLTGLIIVLSIIYTGEFLLLAFKGDLMSDKIVILFLSVISLMLPCNTTELPINGNGITIKLEDVFCTEACLKLTIPNSQLPTTVLLLKDGSIIDDIILNRTDTLLPNTNYTFYVNGLKSPLIDLVSNGVSLTTLDTTSQDFALEKYTFGESSSSTLYDVAIIDENNIWAVGEIYLLDSLEQPDPNAYNAVHGDRSEWKLFRFMFYTICGQTNRTSYPAKSIYTFNDDEIFIAG